MTMPTISSVALDIAHHALGPALQLLRNQKQPACLVEAYLGSAVRQVKNWGTSSESTGPVGPFADRKLSAEEASAVYGAFDAAFGRTFPEFAGMGRSEASQNVLWLMEDVKAKLKSSEGLDLAEYEHSHSFLTEVQNRLEDLEDELAAA